MTRPFPVIAAVAFLLVGGCGDLLTANCGEPEYRTLELRGTITDSASNPLALAVVVTSESRGSTSSRQLVVGIYTQAVGTTMPPVPPALADRVTWVRLETAAHEVLDRMPLQPPGPGEPGLVGNAVDNSLSPSAMERLRDRLATEPVRVVLEMGAPGPTIPDVPVLLTRNGDWRQRSCQ